MMSIPRSERQSSHTNGSAVHSNKKSGHRKSKRTAPPVNIRKHEAKGPFIQNDPPPFYKPMLQPGERAQVGRDTFRAFIWPQARVDANVKPNPYRFVFPFNPTAVSYSATSDPTVGLQPYDRTAHNLLQTSNVFNVQFFLNRQEEVAFDSLAANTGPNGTRRFREMGTTYDLEFLWRVFNGKPGATGYWSPVKNSSNIGTLLPTAVHVFLGNVQQWRAFPTSIDINHILYTPQMVPTLTEVSMNFQVFLIGSLADLASWYGNEASNASSGGGSQNTNLTVYYNPGTPSGVQHTGNQ